MHNNREYNIKPEINECTSRGVCSVSPTVSAMHELIVLFLGHIAYYIAKLEYYGGINEKLTDNFINDIASLNSINAVNDKHLYDLLIRNYRLMRNIESTYSGYCQKNNIEGGILPLPFDFDENLPYSKVISIGEKLSLINYKNFSQQQKNLTEILFAVIKSVCANLVQLKDFNYKFKLGTQVVISALSVLNNPECDIKTIKNKTEKLAIIDNQISRLLIKNLFKNFGNISKVSVSHSSRHGKAILVSGNSFSDLHKILEETKDKDIDIYTHSNMLIAHAFEEFRSYKNLIGHYGSNTESCILDYGTFPGSILLTRGEPNNNEYFYRGRLFSNDYFAGTGVIKIENNDFTPLIDAARSAKGFARGKEKESSYVGYDEDAILKIFDDINSKLDDSRIKHLYIIGLNAFSEPQKEYFKTFFANLKSDEFALSFCYKSAKENVYTVNIGNYAPLAIHLLSELFRKRKINKNVTFIYTTCEVRTLSGIITLYSHGATNIYIANCPPTLINPVVFNSFINDYGVKITNDPIKDLNLMRNSNY